jgi:RimJ/RimL family protein N-acetyltransferase
MNAALERGEVIGWCNIQRMTPPTFTHRARWEWVPPRQRRWLPAPRGRSQRRFRRGLIRVELQVRTDNAPAITLYEKMGFVREGVERDAFLVDGEYCDALSMALSE